MLVVKCGAAAHTMKSEKFPLYLQDVWITSLLCLFQELMRRKREGMELITLSLVHGKATMTRKEIQPPNRPYKADAQAKVLPAGTKE